MALWTAVNESQRGRWTWRCRLTSDIISTEKQEIVCCCLSSATFGSHNWFTATNYNLKTPAGPTKPSERETVQFRRGSVCCCCCLSVCLSVCSILTGSSFLLLSKILDVSMAWISEKHNKDSKNSFPSVLQARLGVGLHIITTPSPAHLTHSSPSPPPPDRIRSFLPSVAPPPGWGGGCEMHHVFLVSLWKIYATHIHMRARARTHTQLSPQLQYINKTRRCFHKAKL